MFAYGTALSTDGLDTFAAATAELSCIAPRTSADPGSATQPVAAW
ncbi:hypothetical protein [Streptomyces sp. FH025]|nr:hypothetical protein [Streptomyces sp. FH025]